MGKAMVKLVSRIIYLNYGNTCVRLCDKEWIALDDICKKEKVKRKELINQIKENKNSKLGLAPAIRLFTLLYYQHYFKNSKPLDKNILRALLTDIS